MNDLDFCKTGLEEIVERKSTEKPLIEVQQFMAHRMPEEAADRVALKAWAEAELTKLEERAPGDGVTKIGTAPIAETGRRMSMLQTVMREIEVFDAPLRCRTCSIETYDGWDRPGAISGSGFRRGGDDQRSERRSNP